VRTSSVLVAKVKRSVLLVLHVPSVSVALAPRSPVAPPVPAVKIAVKEAVVMVIVRASQTVHAAKIAVKEAVVMVIAPASQTVHVVKIVAKVAVPRKKNEGGLWPNDRFRYRDEEGRERIRNKRSKRIQTFSGGGDE